MIEEKYNWCGSLGERIRTDQIIIHHRAGIGDAQSVHREHLANGWSGIGYHFYVRKNGNIYRGRPLNTIGAHCIGKNSISIGVCFEGNYQSEKTMPTAQLESGRELISYLKGIFPNAEVKRHSDCIVTSCPGRYFPFEEMIKTSEKTELTSANDIAWEISQKIKIYDIDGFVRALEKAKRENNPLYWGFRKLVNK